ncbi:MAG: hypothetical protein R3E54_03685 [Halioglobus sp.]
MKYPDMEKTGLVSLIVGLAMAGGAQADQHRAEEKAVKDDSVVVTNSLHPSRTPGATESLKRFSAEQALEQLRD